MLAIAALVSAAALRSASETRQSAVAERARVPDRVVETDSRIRFPVNDAPQLALPHGERRTVASVLNVPGPMRYGTYRWDDVGVPAGRVWVRVDLGSQTMSVFRGPHEIGTSVVVYGDDEKPTPTGMFPIIARLKDHRSSLYDAEMPYTLRLTGDGVAIHGSNVRRGLATHGCIGIPEGFAERLFREVRVGDNVFIET